MIAAKLDEDPRPLMEAFRRSMRELEMLAQLLERPRPDKTDEIRGAVGILRDWRENIQRGVLCAASRWPV